MDNEASQTMHNMQKIYNKLTSNSLLRTTDILLQLSHRSHGESGGLVESFVAVYLVVRLVQGGAAGDAQHALVRQSRYLGSLVGTHVDVCGVALART